MQFLFGSDKDHGYGFLYTEGKKTEAEDVKRAISFTVEAGVDAYGMVTFGANSNRPLFFRAKKDESYQREAYYIHGIYRDASPDYFKNEYKKDIFANFIDQSKLDAVRSGMNPDLAQTVNEALMADAEKFAIDKGLLKELLIRLYQGEKLLLSIPDESYNGDTVRCSIAHIFSYLVPSLRKACGYVTGILNIGAMKGVAIRVIPESKLVGTNEPRFNLAAKGHVCGLNTEFGQIVDELISLNSGDRAQVFEWYETLFNGFGSTYQPKKYIDFYKSLHGDAAVAEKIVDTYLNPINDPSVDMVPQFAVNALRAKYANGTQAASMFEVSNVSELSNPLSVLQKNVVSAKKIYLFCDSPSEVYRTSFERVISSIELDDASLVKLGEGMSAFLKRKKEDTKRYQIEFESAIEALYTEQLGERGRIGICLMCRRKIQDAIKNHFDKQVSRLDESELQRIINWFDSNGKGYFDEAKRYRYDLRAYTINAVKQAFAAHNEKHKPLTGIASIGVAQIKMLDETSKVLFDAKNADADRLMSEVVNVYSDCPNIVNFYAAKYALNNHNTISARNNPVFITLSRRTGAISEVSKLLFSEDPLVALKLEANYAPIAEAVITMLSLVRAKHSVFNSADSGKASSAVNSVSQTIYKRLKAENIDPESAKAVESALKKFESGKSDFKMAGNTKLFYESINSAWTSFRNNKPFKTKKKNKAIVWIIAAIVALFLLAGGVAVTLLLTGVLGGDDESSSAGDKTEESGTVSDSSDDTSNVSSIADSSEATNENNNVEAAKEIALIGEVGTESNVSLLDKSQNSVSWTYLLVLDKNDNVYTVAKSAAQTKDVSLSEGQVALGFFVSDTDGDSAKTDVLKMVEFAKALSVGDKLESSDGQVFFKYTAPAVEETKGEPFTVTIEHFNKRVGDTHVVLLTESVDFSVMGGYIGYAVLMESCGDNQYKVTKTDSDKNNKISFADEISDKNIAIVIHVNEDKENADAEKARDSLSGLSVGSVLTASGNFDQNPVFTYTPA